MSQISDNPPPAATDPERTWCEDLAQNAWGAYMTEIETRELLAASALAGPPGIAMELGCDGGRWSIMLHQQGWSNVCTDIAGHAIATCQRRLPEAKCFLVDPSDSRLPVEDSSIDLLLVYEAPPVVDATWFPAEARRVLRKDGVLLFTHLNSSSYRARLYRLVRAAQRIWKGDRFKSYYDGPSYAALRKTLVALGFEIVQESGFCWFPFGRQSNSPLVAPAVRLELLLGLREWVNASPWVITTARSRQ